MAKKKKVSEWDLATLSKKAMLISSIVAALAGTVGGIKTMFESLFSKSSPAVSSVTPLTNEPKTVSEQPTPTPIPVQKTQAVSAEAPRPLGPVEKPREDFSKLSLNPTKSYQVATRSPSPKSYEVAESSSVPYSKYDSWIKEVSTERASTSPLIVSPPFIAEKQIIQVSIWRKLQNCWWVFLLGGLIVVGTIIWWERRKIKVTIETKT